MNIEIDEKLVRFSFFDVRTLAFFQVIMLINLGWHANRSQISCSQCYDSIFTLNQQKMNFEYRNRCFISLFVFRHLDSDLFQVSMHLNLVMHAYRSQISCSQCYYNLIFTLNQRKKNNFEYQNRFLILFFVFRYSDSDIFSSYHAHISR